MTKPTRISVLCGAIITLFTFSLLLAAQVNAQQETTPPRIGAPPLSDFRRMPEQAKGTTVAIQCDLPGRLTVMANGNEVLGTQDGPRPRVVCLVPDLPDRSPTVLRVQFEPADGNPGTQRLLILPPGKPLRVFRLLPPGPQKKKWHLAEQALKQPSPKPEPVQPDTAEGAPGDTESTENATDPPMKNRAEPDPATTVQPDTLPGTQPDTPAMPPIPAPTVTTPAPIASKMGLQLRSLAAAERNKLDIPGGAEVVSVLPNSMATRFHIQARDVVVRVDDSEILNAAQFENLLLQKMTGNEPLANVGLMRASEGISLRIALPLPLRNYRYSPADGRYSFLAPDGWFLLRGQRNTVADDGFDSLVAPDGQHVLIISRIGIPTQNEAAELMSYHQQKLADAQRFSDVSSETFSIDGSPAFRVAYRDPDRRTSVSRIAFVRSNARHIINVVSYRVDDTSLPVEVTSILSSLKFSKTPTSSVPGVAVRPSHGIGIRVHNVDHEASRRLGVRARAGAVVTTVTANSRAARAGVQVGDVILGGNGRVVDSVQELVDILKQEETEKTLQLDIRRGQRVFQINIRSAASPPTRRSAYGTHQTPPIMGIWAVSAGTPAATQRGIEMPVGAVLTEVQPNSPAARAGLRVNDIIVRFGGHEVSCFEDLEVASLSVPIGREQTITLVRGLNRMTTQLTLERGPAGRKTYVDYRHGTGIYTLRMPHSWTIQRSSIRPETNINARDLVTSRDGNYQLNCYLQSKPISDAKRALDDSRNAIQRDLGDSSTTFRVTGLPVSMVAGGVAYNAETRRRVVLYRVAWVQQNRLFVIDCFAPVLSDPGQLPHVLRSILGTIQ